MANTVHLTTFHDILFGTNASNQEVSHARYLESTALATVVADNEVRELLQLAFWSWAVYLHCGVPAAVHPAFLDRALAGQLFQSDHAPILPYRPISAFNTVPPRAAVPVRGAQ